MSFGNRNNDYSFDSYLDWRNKVNYYADDSFLQEVIEFYASEEQTIIDQEAKKIAPKVSYRWRDFADTIAQPEYRPYIKHYDGHNHRIDRIVRPKETEIMEQEIFREKLFSKHTSPWVKLVKMYLIYQNGEACIACPLVCTEGLVEILKIYADTPELKLILTHCTEGIDGEFAIGAQYLSEIQGGSDVPANLLEAVNEDGQWKLYGTKFFCSATHADYALVTAKPVGSDKVALFVVPSWLPGNKEKEIRNDFSIDRIKWKMGTSELTTAELTFNGSIGYPVGPLDRGLANVVGIVLTLSRLTVGLSAAASMTRASREVRKYSEFREAFGFKIGMFPLLSRQIDIIDNYAKRTTAGAFRLYQEFMKLEDGLKGGLSTEEPLEKKKLRFNIRELIMMQKITAAWDSTDIIRKAMSVLGGHGVMEDFSSLPRLYRDAAVNELWEGPRNVLLTQIHRDLNRIKDWYSPADFVNRLLQGANPDLIKMYTEELQEVLSLPHLFNPDEKTLQIGEKWDSLCHRLFHTYQDVALQQVKSGDPVRQ